MGEALDISDVQVAEAYSHSKMLYVDEVVHYGQYRRLKMIEFCEMLVRLGHQKFAKVAGMSSLHKTENVVDILLALIGKERLSREIEIEISSESDYLSDE